GSHRGPIYDHHEDGVFCGAISEEAAADVLAGAVPLIAPAGSVSFHHARTLHGSDVNRSGGDRRLLLFEVMAADAWPIAGTSARWIDWDEYHGRLLCGEEPTVPRMAAVPLRPPVPSKAATSIFAYQQRASSAYYAG